MDDGPDVHVRYREGRAVPDTLPERAAEAGLMLFLIGAAAVSLLGAGATLAGRAGQVVLAMAAVPVAAVPVFVVSLVATVVAGAPAVGGGRVAAPDIYARVEAEPGRSLTAQGVRFDLVDNQPMSAAGCFGAPGSLAGALAQWKVSGSDLAATSHLLVFTGSGPAALTGDAIQRTPALPNAPAPPAGAIVVAIGDGRYASAIWISRGDGSDVHQDPQAVPALRGLAYFNIDPAVAERLRQGRH